MKQHNFNFGDMVQHPEFGRGVVVAAFDHSVDVVFENHRNKIRTIGLYFASELELVPHPDTMEIDNRIVRLKRLSEEFSTLLREVNLELEAKFNDRYFLIDESDGELLLTDNNSLAQTLYTLDYIPNDIKEIEKLFEEWHF